MLVCPRCNFYLKPEWVKGHEVDHCFRCGGTFLDKGKEGYILGAPSSSNFWRATEISERKSSASHEIKCPKDDAKLITYEISYEASSVEVDLCPHCEGLWLDAKEGKKLLETVLHAGQDKSATFNEKPGFKSYLFQAFSGMPVESWNPVHKLPVVTLTLVVALVCAFILQLSYPQSIDNFVLVPADFVAGEKLWTIFTSAFLHGSLLHLLGNLYFLYIFGDNVEDYLGKMRFLGVYISAMVFADLAYIAFKPEQTGGVVGASGAISALLGAYLIWFPKVKLHFTLLFIPFRLSAFWYLSLWLGFNVIMMLVGSPGTAWSAHIGGFVVGLAAGYLFRFKSIREHIEAKSG